MRTPIREEVYRCLDGERDYQDSKAPTSETGGNHTIVEFAYYMEGYMADMKQVASHTWGPEATTKCLDILRKITAMGVACMEQNGCVPRSDLWKAFPRTGNYADDVEPH